MFMCYKAIHAVVTSMQMANIPNVQAMARDILPSLATQTGLITNAKQCIQSGLEYFNQQHNISLKIPLMAFKAAWLTYLTMIRNLNPEASTVDLLKWLSFVTVDQIINLKAEVPAYLAKSKDLDDTVDKLSWCEKKVCQPVV